MRRETANGSLGLMMVVIGSLLASAVAAEPFVPAEDNEVLEHLPRRAASDLQGRELRALRAELAEDPTRLDSALQLAQLYLELGREDGDPRYQGYARAALAPWWDLSQPPAGVLMIRAIVRQNRHDFDRALEDLDRLLRLQPRNTRAWLTRAVVLQVRGDYRDALASCQPLRRMDPLAAAACLAGAGSLSGAAEESYELLRQAVEQAPPEPVSDRVWALTGLAEIAARLGRVSAAEQHFEEALALGVRDLYLLAAYADFLLDQDRPAAVRAMLVSEERSDALLLRLALAESRLGSPGSQASVATLGDRFAESRARGDRLHLGAEARYLLHLQQQPVESLELALENWQVQREPTDARRVLEAALAAKDPVAAEPVVEWLAASRLEDVQIAALVRRIEEIER